MKSIKYIIGGVGFLLLILLSTSVFAANFHDVVINELMWTGSVVSSSDEWIELKNTTSSDIDLTGWKLTKLKDGNELDMVSISSGAIPTNGYFLISNGAADRLYKKDGKEVESILNNNLTINLIDTSVSLSNDHLQIKLYDQDDDLIDTAGDGEKLLAGNNDKKYSMERNNIIGDGTSFSSWHTATEQVNFDLNRKEKGTPKFANSPSTFIPCKSYPEPISKYLTFVDCLEVEAYVTYIVDGDTINVSINGEDQRVRLIGIDAPESEKSSDFKVNEPYYQESKDFIASRLKNKNVKLLTTFSDQYDKYGRLLAAVIVDEGMFNIASISQGLSKTYYLSNPLITLSQWESEEALAQNNHFGIWKYFGKDLGIKINEFMPNPSGSDSENEWIELYNDSKQEIDLSNWILDDSRHGSSPYLLPQPSIISPNGYLIIPITDSGIALNNNGDSVRLFDPSLSLVDEIIYVSSAKENISYMRNSNNKFTWTKTPTRGSKNIFNDPDKPDYKKINKIKDLKNLDSGANVEIEGFANTRPAQIANQYFYMEDNSGGVQIYNYHKNFPKVNIGQKIKVLGEITEAKILRVKIQDQSDIILLNQEIIFDPPKLEPNQIKKEYIGMLVIVKGEVSKLSGQTFYIKDKYSELKIQIRGPTGFKRPSLKRGDIIEITGLLYQSSRGNITLLPRFLGDINIIKKAETKFSHNNLIAVNRISDIQFFNEDDYLKIRGIVNCLPGMLANRYFYIQDETGGIEIYSHYRRFPELRIGDYIEVVGKLSANKRRIKTYSEDNFVVLNNDHQINPIDLSKNANLSQYFGRLVLLGGVVTGKKNKKITVSVNGQKFTIYLKDTTGLKSSILKVGDKVSIMGVVGKYSNEFRINPRFIEDITYTRILKVKKPKIKGIETKSYTKKLYLPKLSKYLARAPKNGYNLKTLKNILKTTIIALQIILLFIILEWLWKKHFI